MLLTELKAELNCHKRKLQLQWSSKVSKRYKRNLIVIDLNSAAGIAGVLTGRIPKIREKFLNANYLQKFIDSNINHLIGKKKKGKDTFITPPDLFEISRSLVLNEINSKLF